MQWIRLGLFQSIQPVIKYQPKKVNVVADVVSHSKIVMQLKMGKPEISNEVINVVMGGSQIESVDIEKWRKQQYKDPALQEIMQCVQNGQECIYQLSSSGLLYHRQGDYQQIIIPGSLRVSHQSRRHMTHRFQAIRVFIKRLNPYHSIIMSGYIFAMTSLLRNQIRESGKS